MAERPRCYFFSTFKGCRFPQEQCSFAHDSSVCIEFNVTGGCRRGAGCNFQHIRLDRPGAPTSTPSNPNERPPAYPSLLRKNMAKNNAAEAKRSAELNSGDSRPITESSLKEISNFQELKREFVQLTYAIVESLKSSPLELPHKALSSRQWWPAETRASSKDSFPNQSKENRFQEKTMLDNKFQEKATTSSSKLLGTAVMPTVLAKRSEPKPSEDSALSKSGARPKAGDESSSASKAKVTDEGKSKVHVDEVEALTSGLKALTLSGKEPKEERIRKGAKAFPILWAHQGGERRYRLFVKFKDGVSVNVDSAWEESVLKELREGFKAAYPMSSLRVELVSAGAKSFFADFHNEFEAKNASVVNFPSFELQKPMFVGSATNFDKYPEELPDADVKRFASDSWQYIVDAEFSKSEEPTTINAIKAMALCLKLKLQEIADKKRVRVFELLSEKVPVSNTKNFSSASLTPVLSSVRFIAELIDQLVKVDLLRLDARSISILNDVKVHSHWTHHLEVIRMEGYPHYEVTWPNQARMLFEIYSLLSSDDVIDACAKISIAQ